MQTNDFRIELFDHLTVLNKWLLFNWIDIYQYLEPFNFVE